MHMRKSALTFMALLTATPGLAAEQCVKTEVAKYADTAPCILWVDGKLVIRNDACKIVISGDMGSFAIKDVAEVSRPKTKLPVLWLEAHVWKHGKWVLAVSKRFAAETRDEAGLRCELLFPALTMLGSRPSVAGCP